MMCASWLPAVLKIPERASFVRDRNACGCFAGADRVHRELDAAAGAVLEPDRTGQPRRHLAMHLAFGGARADCSPTDQIRDVLRGDEVEKLHAGRHARIVEVEQQAACNAQPLVDVEATVEIGVVDQPLPPDGGARLLEVHTHDDHQPVGERAAGFLQARCVLARRLRIVNRARSGDDEQSVVLAGQYPVNRFPGSENAPGGLVGERKLLEKLRRGHHVLDRRDSKVVRVVTHSVACRVEIASAASGRATLAER